MLTIYITNRKYDLIKDVRSNNNMFNAKFYSKSEFLDVYPYVSYDKTIDYLISKYNLNIEVAKIYLDNIKHYPVEKIDNNKAKILSDIKDDLVNNKLLIYNKDLFNVLKESKIIIDGVKSKYLDILLDCFDVSYNEKESNKYKPSIYMLNDLEEEVSFVGERITSLINSGIDIKNIKIFNIDDSYKLMINKVFKLMHLPINEIDDISLAHSEIAKDFINNLDNGVNNSISYITEKYSKNKDIINSIIDICNKYVGLENEALFIKEELASHKVRTKENEETIKIINSLSSVKDTDYVFFLNFSNEIPRIHKDENYFNDKVNKLLNYDTAKDLNEYEKISLLKDIRNVKNLTITYKLTNNGKESYPSNLVEELLDDGEKASVGELTYNASNDYNKYVFGKMLDIYAKYNYLDKYLPTMLNTYPNNYRTYSNNYTGIAPYKIKTKLKNKLNLSYTTMDLYNKCAFAYYIKYILRFSENGSLYNSYVGQIFHHILKQRRKSSFNFEEEFKDIVSEFTFSNEEMFHINLLKEDIKYVLDVLAKQDKYSSLDVIKTEEPFEVKVNDTVTFKGQIDRIDYNPDYNLLTIRDYKTGNPSINTSIMPLGLSLQLPSYLYLLNRNNTWKDYKVGGFFFQPILPGKIKYDGKKSYEQLRDDTYKLVGYSTERQEDLALIDSGYMDSSVIHGMKLNKKGDFYSYTKTFNEDDITLLDELVSNYINKDSTSILNAEFSINPKILDNKTNISCDYCPFKDICFHENKDLVNIESDKNFLKKEGADNGELDN